MAKGIKIKYKNDVILDYSGDIELKLPTNGKYMESDIDIEMNCDNSGTVNITQNGTASVDGYVSANVNVPNSYAAGDEGKVVSNGALVAQTSTTKTANGTYTTTTNNQVVVAIPVASGESF